MRILNILLATTLAASPTALAASIAKSVSVDAVELAKRTVQLDKQSRASLGVGIRALGLLIVVSRYAPSAEFYRKDSLVNDGLWPALQDLEKNGYVRLSSVTGDPFSHGRDPNAEVEKIVVTDKGKAVARALSDYSNIPFKF